MLQKAKQRLLLLGMQDAQIKNLLNTGEILYRIPVYSNASGYILEKIANRNTSFAIKNMSSTSISSDGDNMGSMSSGSSWR